MKSTLALSLSLSFTFNSIFCLPSHSNFRRGHALVHHHRREARAASALSDAISHSDLFFTKRSLSLSDSSSYQEDYNEENQQEEADDNCEEEEVEEETDSETPPPSPAPVVTKPTDTYISPSSNKNTTSSANPYEPLPEPVKANPVESKPAEKSTNNSTPYEPKPKPPNFNSSETKPPVTKPVETKPDESKPVETKPAEMPPAPKKHDTEGDSYAKGGYANENSTKQDESKPVEAKPVETKPVETKPAETKPVEIKPVEAKPADTLPAPKKHVTKDDSYTRVDYTQGSSSGSYSGKATFFTQEGAAGACGKVHADSDYIVAIEAGMYGGGKYCGKKIAVTRVSTGKTITCIAADECPGCASASLDLSTGAFNELGTPEEGTFAIHWSILSE